MRGHIPYIGHQIEDEMYVCCRRHIDYAIDAVKLHSRLEAENSRLTDQVAQLKAALEKIVNESSYWPQGAGEIAREALSYDDKSGGTEK